MVKSISTNGAILLTLLFIGLKLIGIIQWSWVWVLSPLWLGYALAVGIILLIALVTVGQKLLKMK